MYIRLESNWISCSPSPKLPFPLHPLVHKALAPFWYDATSLRIVCCFCSDRTSWMLLLCVSWFFFQSIYLFAYFYLDLFVRMLFVATANTNTADTDHVQVISLGRKLNLLISPVVLKYPTNLKKKKKKNAPSFLEQFYIPSFWCFHHLLLNAQQLTKCRGRISGRKSMWVFIDDSRLI